MATRRRTPPAPVLGKMLKISDLAERLQLSRASVSRLLESGDLPPPVVIGRRKSRAAGPDKNGNPRVPQIQRWFESDLAEFLARERGGGDDGEAD